MSEDDLIDFRNALRQRVAELSLPYTDVEIEELHHSDGIKIRARCTDDPTFAPPIDVRADANGVIPDGPWNHRKVFISVVPCVSEDTNRPVLSTTVTYTVDAGHANYFPLPESCKAAGFVQVQFNWEFDRKTMHRGLAEMRDEGRMHYFSVLPPKHVVSFVRACKAEVDCWL